MKQMIAIYELGRLSNRMLKECILAVLSMIFSVSMVSNFLEARVKSTDSIAALIDDNYRILLALVIFSIILLMRVILKSRVFFTQRYFTLMPVVELILTVFIWSNVLSRIETVYVLDNNQSNTLVLSVLTTLVIYFYIEHLIFIKVVKQPIEWKNSERHIKIDEIANMTYFTAKIPKTVSEHTIKTMYRTKWLGIFMSDYSYEKIDTFDLAEQIIE